MTVLQYPLFSDTDLPMGYPVIPEDVWNKAREDYMSRDYTLEQICDRHGMSHHSLSKRIARGGWKDQRNQIEQSRAVITGRVSNRVIEKVSEKASERIAQHLEKVLTSGNSIMDQLQDKLAGALLPDITRLDHLESATRSYRSWDDLVRRAHGLADPTARIDITTGGLPMHEKALAILQSCQKMVADGKASTVDVDVDGLVKRMEDDGKGGDSK